MAKTDTVLLSSTH